MSQPVTETQSSCAMGSQENSETHTPPAMNPGLVVAVEAWEDAKDTRTALVLRIKAMERGGAQAPKELLVAAEYQAKFKNELEKLIRKEWRKHPLSPWAATVHGLGEHSVAYLLAKLNGSARIAYPKFWVENKNGDSHNSRDNHSASAVSENGSGQGSTANLRQPAAASNGDGQSSSETHSALAVPKRELHAGEPYERSVSQLWSYCQVGDPERKRRVGMSQEEAFGLGNSAIGPRLHLIATSFIKAGNEHYRAIYDQRRKQTEDRDWTKGHSHNDALRIIKKRFLVELYDAEGNL